MADMAENSGTPGKPWWESQMDWHLPDTLHDTLRMGRNMLRNIPQTLSAYRLGKESHMDNMEPDPVEKIAPPKKTTVTRPMPRIIAPPPNPPAPVTWGIPRAVNMPTTLPKVAKETVGANQNIGVPATSNVAVRADSNVDVRANSNVDVRANSNVDVRANSNVGLGANQSVGVGANQGVGVGADSSPARAAKDTKTDLRPVSARDNNQKKCGLEQLLDPNFVDYQ